MNTNLAPLSQDQRDEYLSCVEISGAIPLYLASTTAESGVKLPPNFREVANAAIEALDIAQSILEASRSSHFSDTEEFPLDCSSWRTCGFRAKTC